MSWRHSIGCEVHPCTCKEPKYRTIVVDPPWHYGSTLPAFSRNGERSKRESDRSRVPYSTLTVEQIAALDIPADDDAHLYLWTTNTHLPHVWTILEAWRFTYSTLLVWCKKPMGAAGMPAYPCHTEYVVFARRGRLPFDVQAHTNWYEWPRAAHSAKPEAFLDLVESVSPGPYLELFARRQRLGWDTWGNEALEHVTLEVGRASHSPKR
jgi:N6-adenosine-specific RNA methylase IME4